jgi:hypothetical protein
MPTHKKLMFMSILCGLYSCKSQEPTYPKAIGIGLLTVNTQKAIPLFKSEKDSLPFDTIKFKTSKSGTTLFISTIKLKPYLISKGDSDKQARENIQRGLVRFSPELKFCVVDTGDSFFKVITNQASMESFVIKKDSSNAYYTQEKMLDDHSCVDCPGYKYNPNWYLYETWDRYLKRVQYVTKKDLVIYDAPNGKVVVDKDNSLVPLVITSVKGDWARVKTAGPDLKQYNGWTKWREETKRLIDVTEKTYD